MNNLELTDGELYILHELVTRLDLNALAHSPMARDLDGYQHVVTRTFPPELQKQYKQLRAYVDTAHRQMVDDTKNLVRKVRQLAGEPESEPKEPAVKERVIYGGPVAEA